MLIFLVNHIEGGGDKKKN